MINTLFPLDHDDIRQCIPCFQMLFDHIRLGIIIADRRGTIVYYNSAQAEIDNLTIEAVLERHMCDIYDFTPENSPALRVITSGQAIIDQVNSYRTRYGHLINASCAIYPLHSKNNILTGAVCYSQNFSWLDTQLQNVLADLNEKSSKLPPTVNSEKRHYAFSSLVGGNEALQKATKLARIAAKGDSSVMLIGETGVGKEIYAQSIHHEGPRRHSPYTAINCSAVPETLLEGILFGTVKGAFTGALNKPGLFEVANKGTLFLDEVDSMPIGLQGKLLRALQEKRIRRVGEEREREIDVRIISAVGRPPLQMVHQGALRPDFYYRLGVIKIPIPTLRERFDDLPALTRHFIQKHSLKMGKVPPSISLEAMTLLQGHAWPGNVRELEHTLEAAINIVAEETEIQAEHIATANPDIIDSMGHGRTAKYTHIWHQPGEPLPLSKSDYTSINFPSTNAFQQHAPHTHLKPLYPHKPTVNKHGNLAAARLQAESEVICNALQQAAGNQSLAAKFLGISPQSLFYKIKKLGISVQTYKPSAKM